MLKLQVTYNTNITQSHIWYKQFEHHSKNQSHIGGVGPRTKTKYFWRIINIEDRSPWRCGRRRENQNFELKKRLSFQPSIPSYSISTLRNSRWSFNLQSTHCSQRYWLALCYVLCVFLCLFVREGERLYVCVCESVSVCLSVSERIQANLEEEAIHIEHIEHR